MRSRGSATGDRALSGVAHSPQNFARGRFSAPQRGQRCRSGAAHSIQNFAPSGFSDPQLRQRIGPLYSSVPTGASRTFPSGMRPHAVAAGSVCAAPRYAHGEQQCENILEEKRGRWAMPTLHLFAKGDFCLPKHRHHFLSKEFQIVEEVILGDVAQDHAEQRHAFTVLLFDAFNKASRIAAQCGFV